MSGIGSCPWHCDVILTCACWLCAADKQTLVDDGRADLNARNSYNGETALHHCARTGAVDKVRLLLSTGRVDVTILDTSGGTAEQLAAKKGHDAVVDALQGGRAATVQTPTSPVPVVYSAFHPDAVAEIARHHDLQAASIAGAPLAASVSSAPPVLGRQPVFESGIRHTHSDPLGARGVPAGPPSGPPRAAKAYFANLQCEVVFSDDDAAPAVVIVSFDSLGEPSVDHFAVSCTWRTAKLRVASAGQREQCSLSIADLPLDRPHR